MKKQLNVPACRHGTRRCSRKHSRIGRATKSETTHTNITFGQKGRDSMILVHWFHNCLLFAQQSFSHKGHEEHNSDNSRLPRAHATEQSERHSAERKAGLYRTSSDTDSENRLKTRKALVLTWRFSRLHSTANGLGSRNIERYKTAAFSLDISCGLL